MNINQSLTGSHQFTLKTIYIIRHLSDGRYSLIGWRGNRWDNGNTKCTETRKRWTSPSNTALEVKKILLSWQRQGIRNKFIIVYRTQRWSDIISKDCERSWEEACEHCLLLTLHCVGLHFLLCFDMMGCQSDLNSIYLRAPASPHPPAGA